jgi:uncharacterized protein (TIGR00661 family)
MRIAYGVHGYGRGHATRALAVVESLRARHEVLLFAGGDAYEVLNPHFLVQRIPCLGLGYRSGRRSKWRTLHNNLPALTELWSHGASVRAVVAEMRHFDPEVVICDAEPWTTAAAKSLRVPRIGFDHFGVLVHCRVALPMGDWLRSFFDRLAYRLLMRSPERVLVSSFFGAEPRRAGVQVVGPLLGEQVGLFEPVPGRHLLVYFNQGSLQVTPEVLAALGSLGDEVRLYGLGRVGVLGNLTFRAPRREAFLEDLASCRAVLSTAGNQLVGEALAYSKPVLVMPEATVEQRLNAREIVRMGVGESLAPGRLSSRSIREFLERADGYAVRARELASDGRAQAVEWLERWLIELSNRRREAPAILVQPV